MAAKYTHNDRFKERNIIFLPCDDSQEALEFVLTIYNDSDSWCEVNVLDTYTGDKTSKISSRFKRAWKAFWAKPIYTSGICVNDTSEVKKFFFDCIELINNIPMGGKQVDDNV